MSESREPSETVDLDTVDLGDERYVRQRKRTARAQENIRASVLRNVMASIDGREWIFELLGFCHIYETSFTSDALVMAAREGERNVGLKIVWQIQTACPEQYLTMMKEAKDRADVRD